MFPSIFTDELKKDFPQTLPILKSWGLDHVDLRGLIFGKAFENLTAEELVEVKRLLDEHGMQIGCLQSSLAKAHLPSEERQRAEREKLEGVIRAADTLGCRLVRAFFFWQPKEDEAGHLAVRPDMLQQVLTMFAPLAARAKEAGLTLAFENCGVTTDEVAAVVDALGVSDWGLAWDVSNGWMSPERQANETDYIIANARRARCVHVKAVRAVAGVGDETIPYDRVLATCLAAGMEGPVSAETHNPDKTISDEAMSHRVVQVIQRAWPSAAPASLYEAAKPKPKVASRPWENDPVTFVVVGLGMGHNRARQVHESPGTRLLGVCDLLEERAKRSADEYGVPYTLDVRPWLDNKDVDVVYVMTPTGRHAEIAKMALEAGKHVITTKPMEASMAACDEMIRLAEKNNLLLAVDFGRRFEEDLHTMRNAVRQGMLGDLLGGDVSVKILRAASYFQGIGSWHGTKRWDGGGVLSNQSIHHIDEVAFTVGIPSKVRANVWTQTHDIEAEDLGVATWLYDNGLVLTFMGTTSYPQPTWYYRFELHGSQGAFSSTYGGMNDKPTVWWYLNKEWTQQSPEAIQPEWLNAADNMAAAIRTGAALTCDGRDGRRSQAILDAMYRSAYSGGDWVDVKPELY